MLELLHLRLLNVRMTRRTRSLLCLRNLAISAIWAGDCALLGLFAGGGQALASVILTYPARSYYKFDLAFNLPDFRTLHIHRLLYFFIHSQTILFYLEAGGGRGGYSSEDGFTHLASE